MGNTGISMNFNGNIVQPPGDDKAVSMVGAIDMGSKNFKFVFAQEIDGIVSTELVGKERMELGKEVTENNGLIGEKKIAQIRQACSRFVQYCSDRGAPEVLAIATSAIRNARNHERIIDIARETGLTLDVADGVREGEVGYFAATGGAPIKLVSDLGSKSLQIAWEIDGAIRSRSVPVGYELAYESFVEHEAALHETETKFRRFLDGNFTELPGHTDQFIALAANTVTAFVTGERGGGSQRTLTRDALNGAMSGLRAFSSAQYENLKSSLPNAAKILPGLIFLDYVMERSGHREAHISENELPVGLVVEYFRKRT